MLPPRLKAKSDKAEQGKTCPSCGTTFFRKTNKYSHQQWEEMVFCSKSCAQVIPESERLINSSAVDRETGCWIWQGVFSPDGYGRLVVTANGVRKQHRTHRLSYENWKGPIPDGLMVLHDCDNPKCINPDHLRVGTHEDNMLDKVKRNRCRNQYMGAANAAAKN